MPVTTGSRNAARPSAPSVAPRRPQGGPSGRTIELVKLDKLERTDSAELGKTTATKLLGTITELKDVTGTGQESAAKGDPRVTLRRRLVATLLADRSGFVKRDELEALGDNVKADIKWLLDAERREYTADGTNQFSWAQSVMSSGSTIESYFKTRVKSQREHAERLEAGTDKFFKADQGSVVGLSFIERDDLRAGSIVDALLQFRANTKSTSSNNRADKVGPSLLAEQRILLANSDISDLSDPTERRELGLLRAMIASHPNNSMNAIFEARNAVAAIFLDGEDAGAVYSDRRNGNADFATSWIIREKPPGADVSPYSAIHHNFSTSTPKVIASMVDNWLLPIGEESVRSTAFLTAADVLEAAQEGDREGAVKILEDLEGDVAATLADLKKVVDSAPAGELEQKVVDYLQSVSTKDYGANKAGNIHMAAELYRHVCDDRPSREGLSEKLFRAGDAWPEVAEVLFAIDKEDDNMILRELGEARIALRNGIATVRSGFERQELILLDADLDRMVLEELGSAVTRVGRHETDEQKTEALWALSAALRSAVASGLDVMHGEDSTMADRKGLDELRLEVKNVLKEGKIDEGDYRRLMAEVRLAITGTIQDIRSYFDERAAEVATGGVELDPEFHDQFIKQSALHYATAIADVGMTVGLKEEISADRIANVEGMRILNSIGRVVFSNVVAAENTKELAELKPEKDALSVVYALNEKKMVAVGGLIVDTEHAPGGNSHLNMYAMNNGIAVLALPELRTKYAEFFETASKPESEGGGGIYMSEDNGEFQMLTVARAKAEGLLKADEVDELRPGLNRRIEYLKSNATGDAFEVVAKHAAIISPERRTQDVQLYIPMDEVKGLGKRCLSFDEIATLGTHARHLVGEKTAVLALMRANPKLRKFIPPGSGVTTGRIRELLKEAKAPTADNADRTLNDLWKQPWLDDPKVGTVDDTNIYESAFYTDKDYRADMRNELQHTTKEALTNLLIATDGNGDKKLTDAGQKLYDELFGNPELADKPLWITRSSFTGEDRPGKSGAGQYESPVLLGDAISRVEGLITVIESTWMPEPIENNVADEIDLRYIMPSIGVQECLDPQYSGVMISRDIQHGTRNKVTYQLVKGFGGGVEGGKTEEGVINAHGHHVSVEYPGEPDGLVDAAALKELREIILEIEKMFHETIEPGKGYAVDCEVCRVDDEWKVVQARVILMDK